MRSTSNFQTEKLLPVVEENQKGARNLQEVNDSSPAPSQGVTVKAEPADNGYEITNQSSAEVPDIQCSVTRESRILNIIVI